MSELGPEARALIDSTREPAAQVAKRAPQVKVAAAPKPIVSPAIEARAPEAPVIEPAPSASVARVSVKPAFVAKAKEVAVEAAEVVDELPPSLQTEIELLSFAQAALRDGEHDRALSLLAEHATRFPNGMLALERDAVRAITLCNSGRMAAGQLAADALAPRMSNSPLAVRLKRACER